MCTVRFVLLPSRDTWTWGTWQLHARRAVVAASLWLIVLTIFTSSTQPAQAQGEDVCPPVGCGLLEEACDVTGFLRDLLPDWLAQLFFPTPHDEFDFRWRPHCRTPPQSGCWFGNYEDDPGTDVMTAVNVATYFWATGNLDKATYRRPWVPVACTDYVGQFAGSWVNFYWTWIDTPLCLNPQWCFGDGNWGFSPRKDWWAIRPDLKKPRPAQYYEFSSYGQKRRTTDGQPAFEVTIITFWELKITCYVYCWLEIPVPPYIILYPCGIPLRKVLGPYKPIPICKDHAVAVKQVQSVLVPEPWSPFPEE